MDHDSTGEPVVAPRERAELYMRARNRLHSEHAAVRFGGLLELEQLAERYPGQRAFVIRQICAYLRVFDRPVASQRESLQERQTREAAQRILAVHSRTGSPHHWEHDRLDLRGAVLQDLDFSDCRLTGADFREATFVNGASFDRTEFRGPARFEDANFDGTARFPRSVFTADARFEDARFAGNANFAGARFHDAAIFVEAEFGSPNRGTRFDGTVFAGSAEFGAASFRGAVRFSSARFEKGGAFRGAVYDADARFDRARFHGLTWFSNTTFTGRAHFDGADFGTTVWFDDARFIAGVTFHDARSTALPGFVRTWPPGWLLEPDPQRSGNGRLVPAVKE